VMVCRIGECLSMYSYVSVKSNEWDVRCAYHPSTAAVMTDMIVIANLVS
jgi:hypothetical protein